MKKAAQRADLPLLISIVARLRQLAAIQIRRRLSVYLTGRFNFSFVCGFLVISISRNSGPAGSKMTPEVRIVAFAH
jgi:hypothetical protein